MRACVRVFPSVCLFVYMCECYAAFLAHTELECNDTDIRLVGGSSPNEGRVEYCSEGVWGTVCGYNWHWRNALVVCTQLQLPIESEQNEVNL